MHFDHLFLSFIIDFAALNRNKIESEGTGYQDVDEFDTTIHGPWMLRWEITHPNRHTASLKTNSSSWHSHKA